MINRRGLIAGATALAFASRVAPAARAQSVRPSIADLVRGPEVLGATISPDGKQLAVLGKRKVDKTIAAYVALSSLPVDQPGKQVDLSDLDVVGIRWAKNDRLLVSIDIWKDAKGHAAGLYFGDLFIPVPSRRVYSIDTDGKNPVALFADEAQLLKGAFNASVVIDPLPKDERRILMQIWDSRRGEMQLHHVDVYTGEATLFERGTSLTDSWITQDGVPILRHDSTFEGTAVMIYGRAPGEANWKLIRKSRRDDYKRLPDFDVVGATPEPGVVLVCARLGEENTRAIREFDVRTLQFGKVVASNPRFDLEDALVDPAGKFLGAAYVDDRLVYDLVDPKLARHYRGVSAFFENRCDVRFVEQSVDGDTFVLEVSGPTEPGAFHIYDVKHAKLQEIGIQRPWLDRERLAKMAPIKVKTRDGAEIACYLTTPADAAPGKPLPMVVMPHGGPEVRDHLTFDVFAQTLAAQGWLVLQPNFRGSGGYGRAFAELGHKRFGDRMQEDVEDAVAQVVASGRADPNRMAIFGFSYGGYAALMGAILKPDLYKAVVAGAADADLFELLNFARREEGAQSPTYAYWRGFVGDPKLDQKLLEAGSPARRAAEIKAPVLLIHGSEDRVVTPKQSALMVKALKAQKKPYEFIELKGEGHSGWSEANLTMVLERSVAFIARYI